MKNKKQIYLLSFFLPMLIMAFSWIANGFFPFGNRSLMAVDFNAQYIGLYAYMKHVIQGGDWASLFYSFSKSIGGGMLGIWGFNLLSPFNLLFFLFSERNFQYAVILIIGLRYGFMGLAMQTYLDKRQGGSLKNPWLSILISTAYALNGFTIAYQMNPIFYDGMIVLPFVLIAMEEVLDGKASWPYILWLALAFFLHYYMAYMIAIFIVLYGLVYILSKKDPLVFKSWFYPYLKLGLVSVLGVGLVAFLLVPIVLSLVSTKGGLQSSLLFEWKLQINPLEILAKFNLGAFDNTSWPAGPNLPNVYIGSLGIIGALYFFLNRQIGKKDKILAGSLLAVFLISCAHEFTSKLWHMGQNPAGFFYRFSWIICFYLLLLAFQGLRDKKEITSKEAMVLLGLCLLGFLIVLFQTHSFLPLWKKIASLVLAGATVLIFWWPAADVKNAALALLVCLELGVNASLVQNTVQYTDAYKYQDALDQLTQAIDPIRPDQTDFYRINKSFNLSKNDPFMVDYPGLSVFSSNLENSSRDLFDAIGSTGINATTYYYGTPLMDALFAVKYLVTAKPVYTDEFPDTSKMYVFGNQVSRLDLTQGQAVYENKRTSTYQVDQTLPIAFGVSQALVDLQLEKNQPIANLNAIAQALSGTDKLYLQVLAANEVITSNFALVNQDTKPETYRRVDPASPASITYRLTPQSDQEYWVTLPTILSYKEENNSQIRLNGAYLPFYNKYQATQLVNIASNALHQAQELTIQVEDDKEYYLGGLRLARSDSSLADQIIQERQAQGLDVESWNNHQITGQVTISDQSTWMFTSIPYDPGWTVMVDGQKVETKEIWNALMAFPITQGTHQIQMTFLPQGLKVGSLISGLSLLLFALGRWKKWI